MRKKRNLNTKKSTIDRQHQNSENVMPDGNFQKLSEKPSAIKVARKDQDILYLANGYAVSAKCVQVENIKPSEFINKNEESFLTSPTSANNNSFLKYLIQKYKSQNIDTQNQLNKSSTNINNSFLQASNVNEVTVSPLKHDTISHSIPITITPLQPTLQPTSTPSTTTIINEYSVSSKKSSHDSAAKSGTSGSTSGGSGSSNKNSKLISQIIEANATKAIQQQQYNNDK